MDKTSVFGYILHAIYIPFYALASALAHIVVNI